MSTSALIRHPVTLGANLMTVEELAQVLHVSPAWVRDHSTRKQPRLPVVRVGKLLRFCRGDIDEWIRAQKQRAC